MGKRGPKPETQLRVAPEVGKRQVERPEPMPGMSENAAQEWRRIVGSLPPEYFKPQDYHLLQMYCEAYARHLRIQEIVASEGEIVPTGTGSIKAHPGIAVMTAAAGTMASLAVKLGISRSARRGEDKDAESKPATSSKRKMFNG